MKKQRSPGAERLYCARRAASKELNLPTEDWRVKRYAVLMVAYDTVQAKLATGANINIDGLLRLDVAMQEIRSNVPPEPVKVEVELVEGPIEHCPKCGWHRDEPLPPPPTPPSIETKSSPPAPLPAAASNVVELPRRGGSIHDAVLPDGTPARMARSELWRYTTASDPVPVWGARHSLPPIPPECFPK